MARRRFRRITELKRVLGWPALYSTAYGNVGSSIYYALGVVAAYALGLSPVVFMVAGALFALTSLSYAEAASAVPEAGGSSSFARRSFNELVSFGGGWALMLDYIITIAISAFFVPNYLAVFFPVLKEYPWNVMGGVVVILFLVVMNVIGVKEAARLNITLAVLDLLTQLFLVVVGMLLLLSPDTLMSNVHWGIAPTWSQLLYGISIAMVAYTGIETVSNLAGEAKDPGKTVPRSIIMVLITVLAMYAAISVIALSVMPVREVVKDSQTQEIIWEIDSANGTVVSPDSGDVVGRLVDGEIVMENGRPLPESDQREWVTDLAEKWETDPVMGIVKDEKNGLASRLPTMAGILAAWLGILAATILMIATNAGLLGISRLSYSMGRFQQLPPFLARIHRRFLTPYVAIICAGFVAALLVLPGRVDFLADLYSFGAMIAFTTAHISVIMLRIKEPDLERPFKAPLNVRFKGVELPLTAIVGGLGTFAVWLVVVWTHEAGRYVGFAWLAVGFTIYVLFRRSRNLSLTKTEMITVTALEFPEVEYNNILVPIVGSEISREAMVMACELASEERASIEALFVLEVPMNLPLDAVLMEEELKAHKLLNEAVEMGEEYGVTVIPNLVHGRSAGRTIVEEAISRRSQIVMIGARRKRRPGERFFGRTVDYVLRNTPCKVLVVSEEQKGS